MDGILCSKAGKGARAKAEKEDLPCPVSAEGWAVGGRRVLLLKLAQLLQGLAEVRPPGGGRILTKLLGWGRQLLS